MQRKAAAAASVGGGTAADAALLSSQTGAGFSATHREKERWTEVRSALRADQNQRRS